MSAPRLIENKARCRRCGDTITSTSRHDFVSCKCKAIFVDGGTAYIRRGGNPEDIEELSVYEGVPTVDEVLASAERAEIDERLAAMSAATKRLSEGVKNGARPPKWWPR